MTLVRAIVELKLARIALADAFGRDALEDPQQWSIAVAGAVERLKYARQTLERLVVAELDERIGDLCGPQDHRTAAAPTEAAGTEAAASASGVASPVAPRGDTASGRAVGEVEPSPACSDREGDRARHEGADGVCGERR